MKILFLSLVAFTLLHCSYAQTGNPKSKAAIEARQKEAQKALDQLTPEQRKMMDQMGISAKVPSMPGGVSDGNVTGALGGGGEFGIPKKNGGLIAAIPNITLTAATLSTYIKSLNDFVEKSIPDDAKFTGQNAYSYFKTNKYAIEAIGNESIGFWTIGRPEIAVYIMSKACGDNSLDADLLSNFAAMLSMGGAPHRAIPLLEYLNKQYPDNTTILNNLGQAWFYLGEIDKADTYLEKTVKAFAYHPQANYTQCLIQQSKGNTARAIEKMKNSIAYSYSLDKLNMLKKLGYKVKGSDIRMPFRPDPNPLGMRNFVRPDYPVNYDEEVQLKYVWDSFQKSIIDKSQQLNQQLQQYISYASKQAAETYKKISDKNGNVTISSVQNASTKPAGPSRLYQQTAQRNLDDMVKDGGAAFRLKTAKKKVDSLVKSFQAEKDNARKKFEKQFSIKATQETELAKKGENIGYDICKVQWAYSEWVYKNHNEPLQQAYNDYLHQLRIKTEEELYWKQFLQEGDEFIATQINAKKEWLAALSGSRYLETAYITENNNCFVPVPDKNKKVKLAEFEDMHCAYRSTLDFIVFKHIVECGRSRVEFDAGRLKGNFNFKMDDKANNNFSKGTLEATVIDKSVSMKKGPLQVGASVKAGMGIEFTNSGVEDVYVTGEASINVKSNFIDRFDDHISEGKSDDSKEPGMGDAGLSDKGIEIGATGKMSLISGNRSGNIFVNVPK